MLKLVTLICLTLVGCVVTESGNPPLKPVVTTDSVMGMTGFVMTDFEFSGTVMPAEGTVLVTNLNTDEASVSETVKPDGTYSITVPGSVDDVFRSEVVGSETRSLPVDKQVILDGSAYLLVAPAQQFASCLSVPTLVEVSKGESLIIKNACSEAITFGAPSIRSGSASLISMDAFSVEAGSEVIVDVTVAMDESALLLFHTTGNQDRRAVTVH